VGRPISPTILVLRTGPPHAGQGLPPRPYTAFRARNPPSRPSTVRYPWSKLDPSAATASASTHPTASWMRPTSARFSPPAPPRGPAPGVDAGAEQDLVRVNVADPGHEFLVHQRRLDRPAGGPQPRGEVVAADLQGVGSVRPAERRLGLPGAGVPRDLPEPSVV